MEAAVFFLIFLPLWAICGFIASSVASAKGWSGSSWFWAGFLLGPAGLIGAVGMPDRLLRKYIRGIASKQDAFGAELVNNGFSAPENSRDEIWEGILKCFKPSEARTLSRRASNVYDRFVEIRDADGFSIGSAKTQGNPEGGRMNWVVTIYS
jgi:hypothetical protein